MYFDTYNPYYNMNPNYTRPTIQQGNISVIRVTGIDGAKAFAMPPNSSVALFDGNEDIFYLKTTDGAGFPTIRTFKFYPVENADTLNSEYVTRKEFNELKEIINNVKLNIQQPADSTEPVKPDK
jgi:hypothetical protein